MKRFLVFATAAAAMFSGCTKQYIDDNNNPDVSGSIGFSTNVANSTKGVAKTGFVMGDQFFVYGGKTGSNSFDFAAPNNSEWVYNAPNFADLGAKVSNYGNDIWRYDNPVAWDGSNVTFFAFSPVPESKVDGEKYGITMTKPAVNTIPAIDFEVKGGYDPAQPITSAEANTARVENKKQVDLLWACVADKSRIGKSVDMDFNHALTQLNFSIRSNAPVGHMIRINTIAVKKVSTKATLALGHDPAALGALNYLGGWSAHADVKSFPVNLKNSVAALISDNDVHAINDGDEALMMIPQALTNVELEVCYAYSADGIVWEEYKNGTPVTVKLGDLDTHTHWNPNKAIRYVLNITPGEVISFTAKVEDWDTEGDIEIINANPGKNATIVHAIALEAGDTFYARTGGWITYDDGNGAKPLTTTVVTATAGSYTFAVLANNTTDLREDQIIIQKTDGVSQTIIRIAQASSGGTFNVSAAANGNVVTLDLKAGDVVSIPQTKAAATWVKYKVGEGAETAFSADYTAAADVKLTLTVEANIGAERAATIALTPKDGKMFGYTINQEGVTTTETPLNADHLKGVVLADQPANDVITLVDGGGAWLEFAEGNDVSELTGTITASEVYSIQVQANFDSTPRTATFTVTSGGKLTTYKLTQEADPIPGAAMYLPFLKSDVLQGGAGDVIRVVDISGNWLTINTGGDDQALTSQTANNDYTIRIQTNVTTASRKAEFFIKHEFGETRYIVIQAGAATTLTPEYSDGMVHLGPNGDVITITEGAGWLMFANNNGATNELLMSGSTATGNYGIYAPLNTTTQPRTAKFTVNSGGVETEYTVTQAVTSKVLSVRMQASETMKSGPTLATRQTIIGNGIASPWLTADFTDGTVGYNFQNDKKGASGIETVFKATVNSTGSERVEKFIVIDETNPYSLIVTLYTVTQAAS